MFSLIARRVPLTARRTLFATPQLSTPVKAEKEAPAKAKSAAAPEGGRPTKGAAPSKKKDEKKQKVRVPKSLKPPKRAPGPYFVFYSSFVHGQPKAKTLQEAQALSKRAGEIWRGYTIAEKQRFYDENEIRKEQAKQEREEFFRNMSASNLKELNSIRKVQGKTKFHFTRKASVPATAFILFSNEFRDTADGQALIDATSPEKRYPVRAVVAAATRWRSMSPEEKAPYFERYKKAKEELETEQVES